MIKLDKTTKNAIVDIVIFIIALILCFFALQNYNKRLDEKNTDLNSLNSSRNQYLDETNLMNQYNELKDSVQAYSLILPTQTTVVQWVRQMEIISKLLNINEELAFEDAQLTAGGIVVTSPTASSGTISATLTLSGSYNNIITFIDTLNKSYYYTQIDSINFNTDKPGETSATINLKLFISKNSK